MTGCGATCVRKGFQQGLPAFGISKEGLLSATFCQEISKVTLTENFRFLGRQKTCSTQAWEKRHSHSLWQVMQKPRAKPKIRKLKLKKGI